MQFSIEFYTNAKGSKPVEKFLRRIRQRNKTLWAQTIKGLEKIKNRQYHREPLSKYVAEDLWEIRVRSGTNILRIIYTFAKGKRIVLLHGFIKKSQKTPKGEVKIAQKYLRDFQKEKNRYGKNKF